MGVNTRYVNAVKQIKTELQKRSAVPSVQLFDFFKEKEYRRLRKAMQHLPFRQEKKLLYFKLDFQELISKSGIVFIKYWQKEMRNYLNTLITHLPIA